MRDNGSSPASESASQGQVALYRSDDGAVSLEVNVRRDTVWLSLGQLADLFGRDKSVVSRHVRNIFTEGELEQDASITKLATVRQEGTRQIERVTQFYNLDVIVSVGYRVKSERGRQFRQWATNVLRSHTLDGYTVNPRRLSNLQANREPPLLAGPGAGTSLADRRAALETDAERATAQLALDVLKAWPEREQAEQWAAAVLQLAAYLKGETLGADDDRLLALARLLSHADEEGMQDAVNAVASALAAARDGA
jgi:hypothetical protein